MQSKDRTFLDELREQGEKVITGIINNFLAKKTFPGTRKKIEDAHYRIDRNIYLALYALNIPSKRDLDRLGRKIDAMNEKAKAITGKVDKLLSTERG